MAVETFSPWNAAWHLNAEFARILKLLARLLERQRARGRTPLGDSVQGVLIEDGEAEGLIRELEQSLDENRAPAPEPFAAVDERRQIRDRAEAGKRQGQVLPLLHAARAFALWDAEYDALLLTLAVEHDPRFGRVVAYLNDHAAHTRPTLGLATALAAITGTDASTPVTMIDRPLIRDGLLDVQGEGPLPGLVLKASTGLLQRVLQQPVPSDGLGVHVYPPDVGLLGRLVLDDDTRATLAGWAEVKRHGGSVPQLLFAGTEGSGRTTIARATASQAGLPLVAARIASDGLMDTLRLARREARWHGAALLLHANESMTPAHWQVVAQELCDLQLPIMCAAAETMMPSIIFALPAASASLDVGRRDAEQRFRLWRVLLPPDSGVADDDITELAAKFRITPRAIARAIRSASASIALAPPGSRRLTRESLETACRDVAAAGLGRLAQKLSLPYARAELIVPPEIEAELDLAIAWVTHERQVLDEWGFRKRVMLGRGLTVLFAGPSGTGKTMAAQVLARELGLDLYRVDLSRVMSKYIGDTEKQLAELFDHAESVVLFFDEADALFGKRSEVKDAHDRYANVEAGYLLQRLEQHDGITVLASNRARDMDDAFIRRFHVIVNFPMPSEPDRLRIWNGILPDAATTAEDVDFAKLAREFDVSGGEIKNAALAAAYLAAAEGQPIAMRHLKAAIRREIVKSGRVLADNKAD